MCSRCDYMRRRALRDGGNTRCPDCVKPDDYHRQEGSRRVAAGLGEAIVDAVLVKFVWGMLSGGFRLGRDGLYALGNSRPNSIKIPCRGEKGAAQDYDYVVLNYARFGGRGCFDKLPAAIRLEHDKHAQEVRSTPDYQRLVPGFDPTYLVSRPSSVWLPCSDPVSALRDYTQVVLRYRSYSGPNCWNALSDQIKPLHERYVARIAAMLEAAQSQALAMRSQSAQPNPYPVQQPTVYPPASMPYAQQPAYAPYVGQNVAHPQQQIRYPVQPTYATQHPVYAPQYQQHPVYAPQYQQHPLHPPQYQQPYAPHPAYAPYPTYAPHPQPTAIYHPQPASALYRPPPPVALARPVAPPVALPRHVAPPVVRPTPLPTRAPRPPVPPRPALPPRKPVPTPSSK
jgi:hypothetical protein